jgi:prepilin-type N-terminal cleavage/methylation domain-containing protein
VTTLAVGRYVRGSQGWTLVELMLTLVIFAIVVFAILTLWQHAQTAYFVGSERAEAQGDARVAIDQMSRDLMKAGRDVLQCALDSEAYTQCSGAKLARCRLLASLGGSFSCAGIYIIPTATSTSIKVQMDLDSDGLIDTSAPSTESITYAYDAANRRITRQQGTGTAKTLADNIDSLAFTYEGPTVLNSYCVGAWGALTNTAGSQTERDCIQRVIIRLVARGTVGRFGQTGVETVQRTLRTTVDLPTR